MPSLEESAEQIRQAHAEVLEAARLHRLSRQYLKNASARLAMLNRAGVRPERMGSTVLLTNEVIRIQNDAMDRLVSLHAGIGEMLGGSAGSIGE